MNIPTQQQLAPEQQAPSFYYGTSFLVEEILLVLNFLQAKARNLKQGNDVRCAVQQKLAAEDISKVAGQIKMMADTVARVTIAHLNPSERP